MSGLTGNTKVETDFGFETLQELHLRLQDDDEVGGVLLQTRRAMKTAESVVKNPSPEQVRDLTFRTEDGKHKLTLSCTKDHQFDTAIQGDAEPAWIPAEDLTIGQEVWATCPEKYKKAANQGGRVNNDAQHYYAEQVTLELESIGDPYTAETYTVQDCEGDEFIANGVVTRT